jgi:hypothetical protein
MLTIALSGPEAAEQQAHTADPDHEPPVPTGKPEEAPAASAEITRRALYAGSLQRGTTVGSVVRVRHLDTPGQKWLSLFATTVNTLVL